MSLNEKQHLAMNKVIGGDNIYVSGPGGVGKSYLVRHIMDKFAGSTVLLAPTGIAALNIGGSTIHSAFKLPFSVLTKREHTRVNAKTEDLFSKDGPVRRIIIDEISMVRGDVMACMDQHLRRIRRLNVPFGGLQVIVVGDFFQLPPVITPREKSIYFNEYDSGFAFGGETWSGAGFHHIELDEIMRQSDATFIHHLQNVRKKVNGEYQKSIEFFNRIGNQNKHTIEELDPVFLCTTNKSADIVNEANFNELEGEVSTYFAKEKGKVSAQPAPRELNLKYGTKVMFTANTDHFKNGETGYVLDTKSDRVLVIKESDESEVWVEAFKWEERDYEVVNGSLSTYPRGSYEQIPLKVAYAVTIHKSQGLTLPSAVIDLTRPCFSSGQLYVALSRIKTLEGIGLTHPIRASDAIVDPEIQEFYDNDCKGIGLGF